MPSNLVTDFAAELKSINDLKPPLTKSKIQDLGKSAMKAKAEYKHVVHAFEKFIPRCRPEHKVSVVYIMDSLIRTSRHTLKDKEPFAKRFLSVFPRILLSLLECSPRDQLIIVRTINLWIAHGIFTEEEMAEFKADCSTKGIVTDMAEVERLVKGEKANMSLYKGHIKEKRRSTEQSKFEAHTPPGPPPAQSYIDAGLAPPEQKLGRQQLNLSTDAPPGGISEARFLQLMQERECDFNGGFSNDLDLLKKAHQLMCDRLRSDEEERQTQHGRSISKLLEYDYSDDEDEESEKKEKQEDPYIPMTLEERENVISNLLLEPQVREALHYMHVEKMEKLAQVAKEAQQKNLAAAGLLIQPPQSGLPPNLMSGLPPNFPGLGGNLQLPPSLSQGIPQALNVGLPGGLLNTLPGGFPAGLHNIHNQGPPKPMNAFLQPPRMMGLGLPPNFSQLPPPQAGMLNLIGGGLDLQQHSMFLGGASVNMPPPGMTNPPSNGNIHHLLQNPPFHLNQIQMPAPNSPDEDLRNVQEGNNERHRRKRSRSRDRDRDHKKSRRSRSREKRAPETEEQKRKRKSGFPTETFPETLNVVSRTLWFGRLPANCTEKDIQEAVKPWGTATNINIIPPKACAYVTMENRKSANDILKSKKDKPLRVRDREAKISYSLPPSITNEEDKATWDKDKGYLFCAWKRLPPVAAMFTAYFEGAQLDCATLPPHLNGVFDEFARPIEVDQQGINLSTGGDMELSSPVAQDVASVHAFNSFPNVLGLQPQHPATNLINNSLLLPQQHPLNPTLPPNIQHNTILGLSGQGALPLLQQNNPAFAPPNNQQFSGMPIPSIGAQQRASSHNSFENPNREPMGQFRGSFRGRGGRGGFRGDRGGFHGDRGGFRNNWNDRPPREDFRRDGPPDRRDRSDFHRDGQGDFRRGRGDFRRREWDSRESNRDFHNGRSPDRRDAGRERREGGRRRESRWGSDDRSDFPRQPEVHHYQTHGNEPIPPGVDLNGDARQYDSYPLNPQTDESVVTSTTVEPEQEASNMCYADEGPAEPDESQTGDE